MSSHGHRASRVEVHVISTCGTRDELALSLRPLFRRGVLYIPTEDSIDAAGDAFGLCLTLADQSLVLRAQARPVDPFAHGLITGGYPGFAVELTDIDARGRDFVAELTRSFDGTLPFGVPTSVIGDRRILCRLQFEEQLEPTVLPVQAASPITEVASSGTTGVTGPGVPRIEEESEESTAIIGEDTLHAMAEEESTAVTDENERTEVAAHSNPKLLPNISELDEATAIGPPPGVHSLAPPLPAPFAPPAARAAEDLAQAPPIQSAPALIPDGNGNLLPNPLYNGIPSSILLGTDDRALLQRPVTSTDFITSAPALNRPLIISSLAAVTLGLLTGYLIWGTGDSTTPLASKLGDTGKPAPADDSTREVSDSPVEALEAKPESAKPESAKPESAKPESAKPESAKPESVEPGAATRSTCQVSIRTRPAGAALFHDGAFLGASPYEGPIACEASKVDVRHPHFQAAEAVFAIENGRSTAVVQLERPSFLVNVSSVPRQAIIKRDGAVLGRTPLSIRLPGFESTTLLIARKGFSSETIEVTPTKYKSAVKLRLARKR